MSVACNGNTSATRSDDRAPAVSTSSITVRPAVAWPALSTVDDGALLSLSKSGGRSDREIRALIARSPVPVLAPRELQLGSPTLVVEGEYFALTGRIDGATISLQGTRAAHRYEGIDPATGNRELARLNGTARGFVTTNEGIRTASWIENGAAYSVDVECSEAADARCHGDEFLLSVIAQLSYVGGSGR
ncbi:MAG: hypothetical protein JWO86_8970 [Myxococcaceae bacterium]|nr:hypothetical protein [Myxococcaceae bacterium]